MTGIPLFPVRSGDYVDAVSRAPRPRPASALPKPTFYDIKVVMACSETESTALTVTSLGPSWAAVSNHKIKRYLAADDTARPERPATLPAHTGPASRA